MYDSSVSGSDHRKALECLKKGKGQVTYVSLQEAQQFFKENADTASEYQFVCRNGSVANALHSFPCTWLSQPWPTVIVNNDNAVALKSKLTGWLGGSSQWENALKNILTEFGSNTLKDTDIQKPRYYVNPSKYSISF